MHPRAFVVAAGLQHILDAYLSCASTHDRHQVCKTFSSPNKSLLHYRAELRLAEDNSLVSNKNSPNSYTSFYGLKPDTRYTLTVYAVRESIKSIPETEEVYTGQSQLVLPLGYGFFCKKSPKFTTMLIHKLHTSKHGLIHSYDA